MRWTPQAADDLEAVCLYIARDTPVAATVFAERVLRATAHLADFPEMGRIVPEWGRSEIREVFVYSYRLIYRTRAESVDVLAIHHGVRPLEQGNVPPND